MIYDVIIIGSGASGVAAALGFAENGIIPLVLDVGYQKKNDIPLHQNIYDYRKSSDVFNVMIGEHYEGIPALIKKRGLPQKLISPYMRFVTKGAEKLSPISENGFSVIQSFARGGLANAWGAGLYRLIDDDLINLPLEASELSPYYDKLTEEIGISGDNDDLTPFFGSTINLLPPFQLSGKSEKIFLSYEKKKKNLNEKGIFIGKPRLGILSKNYHQRPRYKYRNLDSWLPLPSTYSPSVTLQELISANKINYIKSVLVKKWIRSDNCLVVHAEDINNRTEVSFKCKKLILAAGTINSTKIVLSSRSDFKTKLPLIDNPLLQIPLFFPGFVGSKLETDAFGLTNLNIICDFKGDNIRLQGSIIELTSLARATFYEVFPFSAKDNLYLTRVIPPSLLVLFLYFPSSADNSGNAILHTNDKLAVFGHPHKIKKNLVREVIYALMKLGAFTFPSLIRHTLPGYAIHYAGTLPMVIAPKNEYQCDTLGELYNEPNVFVVDGSLFSCLPAKNISFTLMANAMRIADHISKRMKKQ